MTPDENLKLRQRLTSLEVKFTERWDSHDRLAKERHGTLMKQLDLFKETLETLFSKIADLPCANGMVRMSSMENKIASNTKSLDRVWKCSYVIIICIVTTLIGLWIKRLMQ